nr:egl nine homolog 1-like [Onthophagus taurus]
MNSTCVVCGSQENLLRCARCKKTFYCSRTHQKQDWKRHKPTCNTADDQNVQTLNVEKETNGTLPVVGSSEDEILSSCAQSLSPNLYKSKVNDENMPASKENLRFDPSFHCTTLNKSRGPDTDIDLMSLNVLRDMNDYGVCVVDNFLGEEKGRLVLKEVLNMYSSGVFKDGQLVSNRGRTDLKTIRGDKIAWVDGKESFCNYIGSLISQVDAVIIRANKMENNGKMGQYNINGRTKVRNICFIHTPLNYFSIDSYYHYILSTNWLSILIADLYYLMN